MEKTFVYLKNYANYTNRIVKHSVRNLNEFLIFNDGITYETQVNKNYNPNNGVDMSAVVNWTLDWTPDYCLVVADGEIVSTWFVLDMTRTRNGQFKLTLKRDVINDNWDSVTKSPCFIEKAKIPGNSPFIFNNEGMTFNQIKKEETLLKDGSGSAWVVGYVASNAPAEDKTISNSAKEFDYTLASFPFPNLLPKLSEGETKKVINGTSNKISFSLGYRYKQDGIEKFTNFALNVNTDVTEYNKEIIANYSASQYVPGNLSNAYNFEDVASPTYAVQPQTIMQDIADRLQYYSAQLSSAIKNEFNILGTNDNSLLLNTNGKIIQDNANNKNYRISIRSKNTINYDHPNYRGRQYYADGIPGQSNIGTILWSAIGDVIDDYQSFTTYPQTYIGTTFSYTTYEIELSEVPANASSVSIKTNRTKLKDSPYDMFCIPLSEIDLQINASTNVKTKTDIAVEMAQNIARTLSTGVYDLQIVPYCPIQNIIANGKVYLMSLTEHQDYELIKHNNEVDSVLLWCSQSSGTLNIPFERIVNDVKQENETDMYRLCSPNYAGIFEFNLAKNGGCSFINVDFTYKPYTPYIHLNPNFGGLYSRDFNDSRGLVCGGDFSIALINDAFETYQVQNKNYQEIFDRGIKNMEVNRKFERISEIAGAITGTAQGAMYGGAIGGGVGGAILGGVASAAGGVFDIASSQFLYKEKLSYQTDLYNYQLGNIQALPDSLSKTSALTFNNKIFPFMEYYTCTEEEKEALRNKLKYNGMTLMIISTIDKYLTEGEQNFIQGQMIRLEDLNEDSHMANAIYDELKKGVFM